MRLADGHDERLGLLGAGAFMRLETGGLGVPALMSALLSALMSALRGEAFWVLGLIMAVSPCSMEKTVAVDGVIDAFRR